MANIDQEQARLHQQLSYEAALPYLREPQPTSTDVENILDYLSEITRPTLGQARGILGAAAIAVHSWVETSDADTVIKTLTPSLQVQRTHIEAASEPEEGSFARQSSLIISGILSADFTAYPTQLRKMIDEGQFGEKGRVLTGVLQNILPAYKGRAGLLLEDQEEAEVTNVATIMDDLIEVDPKLMEGLQLILPTYILFASKDLPTTNPRVYRALSDMLGTQQVHRDLAETYLTLDVDRDELKERIKSREFGDPIDVFANVCAVAVTDPKFDHDDLAEDVWIELLEINRFDPRLRPLREKIMSREWYWDPDSAMLTLVETVESFDLRGHTRIAKFLDQHQGDILKALKERHTEWNRFGEGIELAAEAGELTGRLTAIIQEVIKIKEETDSEYPLHFSDALLLAALHIPSNK